ncbi:MAG: hypothetical protein WB952_13385 [Terriglobales bacterium]
MNFESQYVWMNGKLVAYRDAAIYFLTPGLHYGVGVFEGIPLASTVAPVLPLAPDSSARAEIA